jgi:mono/diheme cytochrome c family protein
MRHVSIVLILGLLIVWTVPGARNIMGQAGGNAAAKAMKNPVSANPQSIAAGQAIYQKSCSVCHGPTGMGDGSIVKSLKPDAKKPSNLVDASWDHGSTDGEIFSVIRDGIGGPNFGMMKPQKDKIKDTDIWNLVNYVRSLAPKGK